MSSTNGTACDSSSAIYICLLLLSVRDRTSARVGHEPVGIEVSSQCCRYPRPLPLISCDRGLSCSGLRPRPAVPLGFDGGIVSVMVGGAGSENMRPML